MTPQRRLKKVDKVPWFISQCLCEFCSALDLMYLKGALKDVLLLQHCLADACYIFMHHIMRNDGDEKEGVPQLGSGKDLVWTR